MPALIDELHNKSMKFIPILDAGIAQRTGGAYAAYNDGLAADAFLKVTNETDPFIGKVWPGDAVYPDFTKKNATDWWKKYLTNFHNEIKFDGIWEDMNEASNFCNGYCYKN